MKALLLIAILGTSMCQAQSLPIRKNEAGIFSLGIRSTLSTFNDAQFSNNGFGYGGQFRVQLSPRINTEWFLDYITSDVQNLVTRTDYHVGWSVMYYILEPKPRAIQPYAVVGHCFDHTTLIENQDHSNTISKGSSAIQAGLGTHFNLSERMDISLTGQYMFHLGEDVHPEFEGDHVHLHREKGAGLEGHLLFNVSINYKIADLWGR